MTKSRLIAVLTALVVLAIPAAASAADNPVQWRMGPPKTGQKFDVYNTVNDQYLDHESRTFGPDLGWERKSIYASRWMLSRGRVNGVADHRPDIQPDEKLSLYNFRARKFLVYKKNRSGINLGFSSTPSAQWKVTFKNGYASLFNTVAGDYVVYGKRRWGINLVWLGDRKTPSPSGVGTVHDASVTMTAQPPVSGFVPFLGSYGGGGTKAVLTKVASPANGATLFFIKRGRSSSECGNPDAVIRLNPGQTMTADQMKALWLSATPSLAQPVPFLACAATQYSSVWVNVQYRITG